MKPPPVAFAKAVGSSELIRPCSSSVTVLLPFGLSSSS
jgi:hypothetical protein